MTIQRVVLLMAGAMSSVVLIAGCGENDGQLADQPAHQATPGVVSLGSYKDIALPVDAPPDGAFVRVTEFEDADRFGEHISFEYQNFTVQACAVSVKTAAPDACDPQVGVETLRVTRDQGVKTVFSTSTKLSDLPADAREVTDFFTAAELRRNPDWLVGYAQTEYDRRYS